MMTSDVDIDGSGVDIDVTPPDTVQKLFARPDAARLRPRPTLPSRYSSSRSGGRNAPAAMFLHQEVFRILGSVLQVSEGIKPV